MSDEKRVDIDFRFDPWGRLVSVSVPVSRIREALAITPPSPAPKVESAEHPSEPSIETLKAQVEYWRNAATERDEADEKPIVQRDRIPGQLAKTENLHLVGSPPAPFGSQGLSKKRTCCSETTVFACTTGRMSMAAPDNDRKKLIERLRYMARQMAHAFSDTQTWMSIGCPRWHHEAEAIAAELDRDPPEPQCPLREPPAAEHALVALADEMCREADGCVDLLQDGVPLLSCRLKHYAVRLRAHLTSPTRTVELTPELEALLRAAVVYNLDDRRAQETRAKELLKAWARSPAGRDFAKNGGSE